MVYRRILTDHVRFELILEISYIRNTCIRRNVSKHFETFTKCVVANPVEFKRKINAIVDYHLKKVLKNQIFESLKCIINIICFILCSDCGPS